MLNLLLKKLGVLGVYKRSSGTPTITPPTTIYLVDENGDVLTDEAGNKYIGNA